ncbi:MAG TPA: DUF6177 family protein [Actinomycetota bacterium]
MATVVGAGSGMDWSPGDGCRPLTLPAAAVRHREAEQVAERVALVSMLAQLRPGRADTTWEPRLRGLPVPVGVAVGPEEVARLGLDHALSVRPRRHAPSAATGTRPSGSTSATPPPRPAGSTSPPSSATSAWSSGRRGWRRLGEGLALGKGAVDTRRPSSPDGYPQASGDPGLASRSPDWVWRTNVALSQVSGMVVASM